MVKHLWLARHAQAAESGMGIPDFDRPLTSEGVLQAARVGKHLQQLFPDPQKIMSSSALRARTTAAHFAEQYSYDPLGLMVEDDLYEASVRTFLGFINRLPANLDRVIIVAHNPAVSYLSEYLSRAEIGNMVPCSAVHLSLETDDWQAWSEGTATFHQMISPYTLG